jgi:hypothetical protein
MMDGSEGGEEMTKAVRSKTIRSNDTRRAYRTKEGAAVSCAIQHQRECDPDDGKEAGFYGWCGLVDDQSDYVLGPYASSAEVFAAYEKRNKDHQYVPSVTLFQTRPPQFEGVKNEPQKVAGIHRKRIQKCSERIALLREQSASGRVVFDPEAACDLLARHYQLLRKVR